MKKALKLLLLIGICSLGACDMHAMDQMSSGDGQVGEQLDNELAGPLFYAVAQNNFEEAKELIEAGEDVNEVDYLGFRPLDIAMNFNRKDMVLLLKRHGARCGGRSFRDCKGALESDTLHNAAVSGELDKAKELVGAGENVNKVDRMGFTPLNFARHSQRKVECLTHYHLNNGIYERNLADIAYLLFPNDPRQRQEFVASWKMKKNELFEQSSLDHDGQFLEFVMRHLPCRLGQMNPVIDFLRDCGAGSVIKVERKRLQERVAFLRQYQDDSVETISMSFPVKNRCNNRRMTVCKCFLLK